MTNFCEARANKFIDWTRAAAALGGVCMLVSAAWPLQSGPILRQETLGTGVTDIADSRLDLEVRDNYEVDPGDLDGDGDTDLLFCHFYLFNPPLGPTTSPPFVPVAGSGGIRTLYNKTAGPGGQPEPFQGPPFPDGNSSLSYSYMRGSLVDETMARVVWTIGGTPPSARDAEIVDLDGDGDVDIVLTASTQADPGQVQVIWARPEEHLAQNRILMQESGVFHDRTFGNDGLQGGTGLDQDRLPLRASNTCGVAVGDLDGDGDKDLVFAEYGPDFAGDLNQVLLNDGQGHFTTAPNPFNVISRASVDVELADIDKNGKLDIVVANANPMRASVVTGPAGGPWTLAGAANKRRNELWLNFSSGGTLAFMPIFLPDPPAIPDPAAPMPYDDPGFWNDTRSVALGDIDNDLDIDILFANNGWAQGEPDQVSNTLIYATPNQWFPEHHGQVSQILLNMGGIQAGVVPKGAGTMGLGDFLDVGYYALPWGRAAHMTQLNPDGLATANPTGGVRVASDFELTRQFTEGGPADVGRPADLTIAYSGGGTGGLPQDPVPDGYPDLLVVRGVNALSTVLINSGDWGMVENGGLWFTKGRFFRGDMQLNADWAAPGNELKSLWEVQPWDANGDLVNDRGPFTGKYSRFEFWEAHELYASDGDWIDLDMDGSLDIAMSSSEPTHGQINGVFFYRGMRHGFRWKGPSDEGAVMPYVNTVLTYGVDSGDIDADGDVDIVAAGVPSALALRNEGGAQGGTEGFFEEHTFQDKGGWLPMTGHAPLYAPLLTETVALFDAESDDGPLEMMFTGYPAYDSLGNPYHPSNEAEHWHFYDTGYHNPVTDPAPTPSAPVLPHCTFYTGVDSSGVYQDRSLATDPANGIPWLDRNGRVHENISDEVRQADLDNDGDEDLVVAYRNFAKDVHPHVTSWPVRLDPATHQLVLSLWMNDGSGHLRDETHVRLGPAWQADGSGADNYSWDALAGDRYEGLAFADVDSDGDLDALTTATTEGLTNPPRNRLFVNMGGAQKSAGGGSYRTGEFRVAGLSGGPLATWGGVFGANNGWGSIEAEAGDFDGDDAPDFAVCGVHPHAQFFTGGNMVGYLLMNDGTGVFVSTDFAEVASPAGTGVALDAWINHPPGGWDATFSVEPGDFDADGDLDAVLATMGADVPRYLENATTSPTNLTFVDRTSTGSAPTQGSADVDAISWVTGWAADGVVDDFDGDGLQDLYIGNVTRTTQDEILLSTGEDPTGPRISRIEPEFGQTTGRILRLQGVNLVGVDTVWFEKGAISVQVSASTTNPREIEVVVPASAPLGLVRVYVGNAAVPGNRSSAFQFTHLNAAPVTTSFVGIYQGHLFQAIFGFRATDSDGVTDIDSMTWRIERTRGSVVTTWTSGSPGPWSYSVQGQQVQLGASYSVKQVGDVFTFEIGDQKAAYGFGRKNF